MTSYMETLNCSSCLEERKTISLRGNKLTPRLLVLHLLSLFVDKLYSAEAATVVGMTNNSDMLSGSVKMVLWLSSSQPCDHEPWE